uniref:sphingomyelin phosphodiesterase n=1 Tax=Ciona savignyi TaxID=51511 RepID=H2Y8G4_CIOSA
MRNSKMSSESSLRKRTKNISKMDSYIEESSAPVSDNIILTPGGPFASSSFVVQGLYKISTLCFTPWCLVLDHFLAIFVRTSDASKTNIIGCCVWTFLLLIALICLTPIAIVGFALWFPLQWWRPRSFSYITPSSGLRESSEKYGRVARPPSISSITPPDPDYGVITANLCLMPEFVAHINNLSDSVGRGGKMAAYFCGEPPHWRSGGEGGKPTEMDCLVPAESADSVNVGSKDYEPIAGDNYDSRSTTSGQWSTTSKERSVSETFPFLSHFVCLQEVFDGRSTDKLISGLRTKYPYIIYDVTQPIHNCRLTLLGSGLCIASLHPFIDISFKPFPCGHHDDKLACKGLLMTKVFLGRDDKGHDLVGFLATTHLQAWSHSHASSVRCRQLDCIY